MDKSEKSKIQHSFQEAFEENVKYSGFSVSFNEVDEKSSNGHFEGTYQFSLSGLSPAECLIALGGQVGENFVIEDEENEITVYASDLESACLAFDGFKTIYFEDEDDAEESGKGLAKSLNHAIEKIINESKKKLNEDGLLPIGVKPLK